MKYTDLHLKSKTSGQVIVEYLLLLVIAVGLALFLTKSLVSRDPNDAGIVVKKWHDIEKALGDDQPDE